MRKVPPMIILPTFDFQQWGYYKLTYLTLMSQNFDGKENACDFWSGAVVFVAVAFSSSEK